MSISKQTPAKRKSTDTEHSVFKSVLQKIRALPQKKFLVASILLHMLFFSALFMHWESTEPAKPLYIPSNIQAHVVDPETLKALQANKEAEQKAIQDARAEEKKAAEQKRQAQLEKQKAKEEALKKVAEEKKRAEQEKLKIKKQKEEKEKLEKARLEKQKELEKQKQLEAEKKKAAELAKEKALEEKLKAQQSKEIQEKENKMREMLKRMEQQQALAKQQADLEAEQFQQQQAFQTYELTEIERFMALIKLRIENLWRIPPKSDHLSITLRIRLLPNGELSSVEVIKSSGSSAFDRSAVLAAKSVSRYPVPDDTRIFEKNFRQFNMAFRPEKN